MLEEFHTYVRFNEVLGVLFNNFAESVALKILLKCALGRNIGEVNIFVDSLLVINWMLSQVQVQSIQLMALAAISSFEPRWNFLLKFGSSGRNCLLWEAFLIL